MNPSPPFRDDNIEIIADSSLAATKAAAGVERQLDQITRRSFTAGGLAALVGTAGAWWVRNAKLDDGVPWPLRQVHRFNERVSSAFFGPSRLAPTFDKSLAKTPRVNGRIGLTSDFDSAHWQLDILGPNERPTIERSLPISAIHALPRYELITEFKCVEGWSQIVQWAGARLADFMAKYGHETPFIGLSTPDREYYVGLDRASALHSQSLLAYEMNGQPLTADHGAPLRLVCPLKYGVKSIKRIGAIHFTHHRPADYWAERGYDWYLGH